MFHYWGFGLNIASELEFPELMPTVFDKADMYIRVGKVPASIPGTTFSQADMDYTISDHEYELDVKDVSRYYVFEGREIIVEPYEGIDSRSVRIFLLATVMAVVLLQRGSIPLHASGIVKDGKLLLFTGDSGAGKSTTLAYLISKGYTVFTDDICVLKTDPDNDRVVEGIASYPMLKLWDDAVNALDTESFADRSFRVRPDMNKYGYFFYDAFLKSHIPIDKVFILKTGAGVDEISIRRLTGMEAFQQLERQAYRKYLISNQHQRSIHFKTISALTASCKVFEISRPLHGKVQQLVETLESLF